LLANTGSGQASLTAELTAAYDEWLAYIAAVGDQHQNHKPTIDPFKPLEGDA
jgi:hypothetical protein